MIRLRVSRRLLRRLVWIVSVLAVLAVLDRLGASATPRDADGRPLVLSPGLWAAKGYRDQARDWARQMTQIDERLAELLAEEPSAELGELYAQSSQMQEAGEKAAALASRVSTTGAPVALVGLRSQAQAAAGAYLNAAVLTARWQANPTQTGRREALEALRGARASRVNLEGSRWLTTSITR